MNTGKWIYKNWRKFKNQIKNNTFVSDWLQDSLKAPSRWNQSGNESQFNDETFIPSYDKIDKNSDKKILNKKN